MNRDITVRLLVDLTTPTINGAPYYVLHLQKVRYDHSVEKAVRRRGGSLADFC